MGRSHVREVIESLQEAIKLKKKEFRHQRGKAYLPEREEEDEDDFPMAKHSKEEEREEEEDRPAPQDSNFRRERQNFMRRDRPKKDGPSISLFEGRKAPAEPRRTEPKQAPGKGKA